MKNFVLFLALASLFVSCAIEGEDTADRLYFDRETFNAERRLWLEQDFQNYSFHLDFHGYANGFWGGTVIVKNGELDSFVTDEVDEYGNRFFTDEVDEDLYLSPFLMDKIDSIDGLCEKINNNYARVPPPIDGFEMQTRIEMEYDSRYHFFKSYFRESWPVPVEGREIPEGLGGGYYLFITHFTPEGEEGLADRLSFDRETFNTERLMWQDQDLQNYSFHLRSDSNKHGFWSGTVIIKDGALDGFVLDEVDEYGNPIEYPNSPTRIWIDSISNLYKEINNSARESLRIDDFKMDTTIELEYDSLYHFPKSCSYKSTHIPLEGQKLLGWLEVEFSIYITNFTLDTGEDAP
jgi:hypothetical protein